MHTLHDSLALFAIFPKLWIGGWAVLGAMLGSFFNAMAWRWPQMLDRAWLEDVQEGFASKNWTLPQGAQEELSQPKMGFSFPRSQCPHCRSAIPIWRNIPIVSWLLLRGRCADCAAPISPQYILVEAGCALLGGALAWFWGPSLASLCFLGFAFTLMLASLIDAKSYYLPDPLTLGLLWAGLLARALDWLPGGVAPGVFGAVLGYGLFWALAVGARALLKRDALGGGDWKLLAALLVWLGPWALPALLLIASVSGLIGAGVSLLISRLDSQATPRSHREIPFGPYLALAGLLCLLAQTHAHLPAVLAPFFLSLA